MCLKMGYTMVYPKIAILLVEIWRYLHEFGEHLESAIEVAISSVRSRLEGPLQWLAIRINMDQQEHRWVESKIIKI